MEEKKIGSIKKISKSTLFLFIMIVIGMLANLIASLAFSKFNSTMLVVFGILLVLVIVTMVVTTILKRGSSKVADLKDSLKETYIDAIDHSSLNPASREGDKKWVRKNPDQILQKLGK